MTAAEYLPLLEDVGLTFVGVEEFGGIAHSVFENSGGTRFIYPGARGYDDEIPMVPYRKLQHMIDTAKAHV